MAIEQDIVQDNEDQFVGADILKAGLQEIVGRNREEAIAAASKLYAKEYQTRREIKDLTDKITKAQASLAKTTDKIAKVQAGDLSALFNNAE